MRFFEELIFSPRGVLQHLIVLILSPFGLISCLLSKLLIRSKPTLDFGVPIIGVGNLVVGGTGKTPLTVALTKNRTNSAVVLRGYRRASRGLKVVSDNGKIISSVQEAGDEAMVYARLLPNASVIVSEDRVLGIQKALELGAKIVFLDDAFRHRKIHKFDILISPMVEPKYDLCLPAGAYRASKSLYKLANFVAKEGVDYRRVVTIQNPSKKMALVTSIANPQRLDSFLPDGVISKHYFADHHPFTRDEIAKIISATGAESLLVTLKDAVKLDSFEFKLSIMELELEFLSPLKDEVDSFIASFLP